MVKAVSGHAQPNLLGILRIAGIQVFPEVGQKRCRVLQLGQIVIGQIVRGVLHHFPE